MKFKYGNVVKLKWTDDPEHSFLIGKNVIIVNIISTSSPFWVEVYHEETDDTYVVRGSDCRSISEHFEDADSPI